jgi:hypothetical protein
MFIALNAEGVAGADGLGRSGANDRQSTHGQQSQYYVAHENLSSAAAVRSSIPYCNPSRTDEFPSTHIQGRGALASVARMQVPARNLSRLINLKVIRLGCDMPSGMFEVVIIKRSP